MVAYLDSRRPGTWLAMTVFDEAAHRATPDLVRALKEYGLPSDFDWVYPTHYRASLAIIGYKGASPGEASYDMKLKATTTAYVERCVLPC